MALQIQIEYVMFNVHPVPHRQTKWVQLIYRQCFQIQTIILIFAICSDILIH